MHRRTRLTACCLLLTALPPFQAWAEDPAVASRLDARGIQYTVDEDGDYRVTYNYADEGRTQLAFVAGRTESIAGFQVREVFAPAAWVGKDGIDGARALALLEESRRQKYGSWEIGGDVLYFVIKLPDNVDATQLEAALDIVAEVADNKEIELSGDRDEL
ncbi:hypothetical protein FZO89_16355 [Luteimonas viscosa]|uniref:Sensory transduction regulator n=1 Tax=Luteimonas viscosa TaxID=1132694 RepID=A0A5D4XIP3_9GAMM|nr:hypothetical protein [Luteimonas viscosa]TYT23793.1 hypothetical protein FZO89_16355 [Luteimonas viscosa]